MFHTFFYTHKCAIFHAPPTTALLPKIKHKELNSYIIVQHNIYSCHINIVLLCEIQHQLMCVMMYWPFSKSYMIFVLGFLHLDTKSTTHKRNIPSTATMVYCYGLILQRCVMALNLYLHQCDENLYIATGQLDGECQSSFPACHPQNSLNVSSRYCPGPWPP